MAAWKIIKAPGGFLITSGVGAGIGLIKTDGKHWLVEFHDQPKFNWKGGISVDSIVGYVRGVERAVAIYGEEVHGK